MNVHDNSVDDTETSHIWNRMFEEIDDTDEINEQIIESDNTANEIRAANNDITVSTRPIRNKNPNSRYFNDNFINYMYLQE